MAVAAAFVMERPTVWQAILSLARKLPVIGRMDGSKAVDIIASIIPEPELSRLFSEALEAIPRFEREISSAEIVVGTYPDGTNHVIKGADRFATMTYKSSSIIVDFLRLRKRCGTLLEMARAGSREIPCRLPRAPQHLAHRALADAVQGFLAKMRLGPGGNGPALEYISVIFRIEFGNQEMHKPDAPTSSPQGAGTDEICFNAPA